jgi:hypothetical protein
MPSMAAPAADPWDWMVPDLIMACGSGGFRTILDKALRIPPFDLTIILRYSGAELRPCLLHDGLGQRSALEGSYLLDAAYTACAHGVEAGL